MTDIIINTILTVGSIGGFLFIAGVIRDEYLEYKWSKQWQKEYLLDKERFDNLWKFLDDGK